jgi:hypothetical protein
MTAAEEVRVVEEDPAEVAEEAFFSIFFSPTS